MNRTWELFAALAVVCLSGCGSAKTSPTTVVSTTQTQDRTKERGVGLRIPEGTRATAFKVVKDQEVLNAAPLGGSVDIVGESSESSETADVILNVILLAIDSEDTRSNPPKEIAVVVALTPAQGEVITEMQKQGRKLSLRLRA